MVSARRVIPTVLMACALLVCATRAEAAAPGPCSFPTQPVGGMNEPDFKYQSLLRITGFEDILDLPRTDTQPFVLHPAKTTSPINMALELWVPMKTGASTALPSNLILSADNGITLAIPLTKVKTIPNTPAPAFPEIGSYVLLKGSFDLNSFVRVATKHRSATFWGAIGGPLETHSPPGVTWIILNDYTFKVTVPWYNKALKPYLNDRDFDAKLAQVTAGRCAPDVLKLGGYHFNPKQWPVGGAEIKYQGADLDSDGLDIMAETRSLGWQPGLPPATQPCTRVTENNSQILTNPDLLNKEKCIWYDITDAQGHRSQAYAIHAFGTDPFTKDHDADGLHDGLEKDRRTDPIKKDSDGDKLWDGQEMCTISTAQRATFPEGQPKDDCPRKENPLLKDSDSDQVTDQFDDCYFTGGDGFPFKAVLGATDCRRSDDDGLNDGEEKIAGTDPKSTDTDRDGIPDDVEIAGVAYHDEMEKMAPISRTDATAPTAYVVLLHAGFPNFPADSIRSQVEGHFIDLDPVTFTDSRQQSVQGKLEVKVVLHEIPDEAKQAFLDSCRATVAGLFDDPVASRGWLSDPPPDNYMVEEAVYKVERPVFATQAAPLPVFDYAHVGRLCFDNDAVMPVFGAAKHLGSWQFMVKMRAPTAKTPLADWIQALGGVIGHQLGHSLGLGHSGTDLEFDESDDADCNPLYPSIMNHGYDLQPLGHPTCWGLGFSSGRLEPTRAGSKMLTLSSQLSSDAVSLEYDVLSQGEVKNFTAERPDPKLIPTDLDFLSCWARGDRRDLNGDEIDDESMGHPAVVLCDPSNAQHGDIYCVNWDQDHATGNVDSLYTPTSVHEARTGQGGGDTNIVSGCKPSEVSTALPNAPLSDHNDGALMVEKLAKTRIHTDAACAAQGTCLVNEPNSAWQVDWFAPLWQN